MSKKIIITELNLPDVMPADAIIVYEGNKSDRVELFYDESEYVIGNIYVAHVNDLAKNINAAFVEYAPNQKAYLSLEDNKNTFFINRKNTTKVCEGDNIVVQIKKEPIKTKDAVCSTNIEFPGKYVVLTYGKTGISVSSKIHSNDIRSNLEKLGRDFFMSMSYDSSRYPMLSEESFNQIIEMTGVIFRTEASVISDVRIVKEELFKLFDTILSMFNKAMRTPARTCIHKAENPVVSVVKEYAKTDVNCDTKIITDSIKYYKMLQESHIASQFYDDNLLPLYKLYSIESTLEEIKSRKVWLKSGGYLVIDYTEAMTVIDVNTGKCIKGKDKENTILKLNIEAATETMRQLRLRNISGIIIVDFIDMSSDENKEILLRHLKSEASKDSIKTSIMGMTRLNLLEMTRKKIRERVIIKNK